MRRVAHSPRPCGEWHICRGHANLQITNFPKANRCSYSLQVEAVTYAGQRLAMRQRTYSVLSDIKTAHRFAPMVAPPSESHDGHPGIAWDAFHKVIQRMQYRCGTAPHTKHTCVNVTEISLSGARKMGLDVAASAKAAS